jgi:hypothetical protein
MKTYLYRLIFLFSCLYAWQLLSAPISPDEPFMKALDKIEKITCDFKAYLGVQKENASLPGKIQAMAATMMKFGNKYNLKKFREQVSANIPEAQTKLDALLVQAVTDKNVINVILALLAGARVDSIDSATKDSVVLSLGMKESIIGRILRKFGANPSGPSMLPGYDSASEEPASCRPNES